MEISSSKILALIEWYGREKNVPEKSYLREFTEKHGLNYSQWAGYTRGDRSASIKIADTLLEIFPRLNLNWLLKDEGEMFWTFDQPILLKEPTTSYGKPVPNEIDIWNKLEAIHQELKDFKETFRLAQN